MIDYNEKGAVELLDFVAKSAFGKQAPNFAELGEMGKPMRLVMEELYRRAFHAGASFAWHSLAVLGQDVSQQINRNFPENPEVAKMAAELLAKKAVDKAGAL